ncbi:MAG: site-specific DNA-methyltransferase [Verrucomicrobia bacterium]|nr:site-specific DNA-methyltransferase [Verrucomicrobiota bacterium]
MPQTVFELKTMDCVEGIRQLPDESVDLVVTSPPYNLGVKYRNYRDSRNSDEYLKWSTQWAGEVRRVLKNDGSFFLNLGACPSNPLIPHELIVKMKASLFVLQNTFHWIKSISITKDGEIISAGHFKPLQSDRFVNDCHEYVFHLTKSGKTRLNRRAIGVPYSDKSNIKRWAHTGGDDLRCRGNNWFIPYKTIVSRSKQRPHPATFPTDLAVFCIKIHGCRPDLVMLDPFLGIGHSALAAKQCGIGRFVGFDIDREYVEVARKAIQKGLTEPTVELLKEGRRRTSAGDKMLFEMPGVA